MEETPARATRSGGGGTDHGTGSLERLMRRRREQRLASVEEEDNGAEVTDRHAQRSLQFAASDEVDKALAQLKQSSRLVAMWGGRASTRGLPFLEVPTRYVLCSDLGGQYQLTQG